MPRGQLYTTNSEDDIRAFAGEPAAGPALQVTLMERDAIQFWRDASLGANGCDMLKAVHTSHRYGFHFHEEFAIALFGAGAQRHRIGRNEGVATPGALVLIQPGEPHTGEPAADEGHWSHRAFYPDMETMASAANAIFSGPDHSSVEFKPDTLVHDAVMTERMSRYFDILEDAKCDRILRQQAFADAIETLLLRLGQTGREPRSSRGEHAAISRAIECMRSRLGDPGLSISELATASGLSEFYFMRSFRAVTGMTAHIYLVQLRLSTAQEKLAAGEAASVVAADCGFFDQSHLIRHFRSSFGVTPSRYAKSARN